MPYEVTATRRRPKTFDELAGQEFVAATLKNSLDTGHIANAYLFSGPRGCGKTSAARILARALRCEKGPTSQPCGVCPQCTEISRGASMDVLEIDGASNTGVNDVRQIKEEVQFPPSTGRYKVYIIDEVHMLSNNAFNALLKTIEEPPPYVVFIFATTELQKVPATIRSRCQQFNFRLIPVDTIAALLMEVCVDMGIHAEEEALFWIARESTGSCRDAYTLFDQVVSFSEGNIRSSLIREKLGLVGLEKLNEFAEACAAGDFGHAFDLIDELLSSGVAAETFITDLAGYYHSLLLIKAGISREAVLGHPPTSYSQFVLEKLDTLRLERAGELLYGLYRDLRYSVSPRFELEALVSKLCWLDKWISPAEMAGAVAGVQGLFGEAAARPLVSGPGPAAAAVPGLGGSAAKAYNPASSGQEAPPPRGGANESGEASGSGLSFSEEFRRQHMAAKPADASAGPPAKASQPDGTASVGSVGADIPAGPGPGFPSGAGPAASAGPTGIDPAETGPVSTGIDPGVKKVLDVFDGTIIEENDE